MPNALHSKIAIGSYFFEMGFVMGNWVAQMPSIKYDHGLSNGVLGAVLVGGVGGAICCLPFVTYLCNNYGSRTPLLIGGLCIALFIPLLGIIVPGNDVLTMVLLILGMIGIGFGLAMTDISVGSQALICEKDTNLHIMGAFHCMVQVGNVVGVLMGGFMTTYGYSAVFIFITVGAICIPFSVLGYFGLYTLQDEVDILSKKPVGITENEVTSPLLNHQDVQVVPRDQDTSSYLPVHEKDEEVGNMDEPIAGSSDEQKDPLLNTTNDPVDKNYTLYFLGIIGCIAFICESSITDWSVLYLTEVLHAPTLLAAFAFAIYAVVLGIGLLLSDYLVAMYSSLWLLNVGAGLASTGFGLLVLAAYLSNPAHIPLQLIVGAIAIVFVAMGCSLIEPIVFSLAGRIQENKSRDSSNDMQENALQSSHEQTEAIAFISSFTYLGFLIGPPLLGGVAQICRGLQYSYLLCGVTVCTICLLVPFVKIKT